MAEMSLYQRLMQRRAAIEGGDPTGASKAPNAAAVRQEASNATKSGRKVTKRPGESDASFKRRQDATK